VACQQAWHRQIRALPKLTSRIKFFTHLLGLALLGYIPGVSHFLQRTWRRGLIFSGLLVISITIWLLRPPVWLELLSVRLLIITSIASAADALLIAGRKRSWLCPPEFIIGLVISCTALFFLMYSMVPLALQPFVRIITLNIPIFSPKFELGDQVVTIVDRTLAQNANYGDMVLIYNHYNYEYAETIAQIIGRPGDRVRIGDRQIFVNDQPLDQRRYDLIALPPDMTWPPTTPLNSQNYTVLTAITHAMVVSIPPRELTRRLAYLIAPAQRRRSLP
jgi:hypothetical protein